MRLSLILLCLSITTISHAGVYKCTDPATGNTIFSDNACATNTTAKKVYVAPTRNSSVDRYVPSSDLFDESSTENNYSGQSSYRNAGQVNQSQQIQAQSYEDRQRAENDRRMQNATRNNNGRPLTLKERGLPSSSYGSPMPPTPRSPIASCDGAGCWDTQGTRYNKAAGNTYFPSTGGTCQSVGGRMECN